MRAEVRKRAAVNSESTLPKPTCRVQQALAVATRWFLMACTSSKPVWAMHTGGSKKHSALHYIVWLVYASQSTSI